jgi:hypothetical protein
MNTALLPISALVVAVFLAFVPTKVLAQTQAQDFTYQKPGTLTSPAAGQGFVGRYIYAPDILFPIKLADNEKVPSSILRSTAREG